MNQLSKKLFAFSVVIFLTLIAGCAGGPKDKSTRLDWKGADIGSQIPEWVKVSVDGGNALVEGLKDYKGQYCFVISQQGSNLDFLQNWAKSVSGVSDIAGVISTTVAREVQFKSNAADSGTPVNKNEIDNAESAVRRSITDTGSVLNTAAYSGVRREADFWTLSQNKGRGKYYTVYVLFTVKRELLDDQIARNLQNIMDKNTDISAAERAIYTDLIASIRANGLRG